MKNLIKLTTVLVLLTAILAHGRAFAATVTPDELFTKARYNDDEKAWFNGLSPENQAAVLRYFAEGIEDGISKPRELKKFGGNLLSYFDLLQEHDRFIRNEIAGTEVSLPCCTA